MVEDKKNKSLFETFDRMNPFPLTWRIWLALTTGIVFLWIMVVNPIIVMIKYPTPTAKDLNDFGHMFICVGLVAASLSFLCAIKAMRNPRGKNWNKWFKRRADSTPKP